MALLVRFYWHDLSDATGILQRFCWHHFTVVCTYGRYIVSYSISSSPNSDQILEMLDRAFIQGIQTSKLILHSDQGWQYQHEYYRNTLATHGIIQSMSRKGNCYDNSIMETFFGRMKTEMYYGCEDSYTSYEAFSRAVDEYIEYYNSERIQAKTKWMPPVKYRMTSIC